MLIFLYGSDTYRRNEKFKELIAPYYKKYGQADALIVDFEEEEEGWVKARDFLGQPSLFASAKVLILKEISAMAENSEKEAAKFLKAQIDAKDIFVFILNTKTPKKIFSFLLENSYKKYFFDELKDRMLEVFVKEEAKKKGIIFEPAALEFFAGYVSGVPEKSWQVTNELEKIKLLTGGKKVTEEDLRKIIKLTPQGGAVFELAGKVLRSGALKDKLGFLERLLWRADATYAFNALAYQVWNKEAEKFADYDVSIKSGGLEYEEALLEFLISN